MRLIPLSLVLLAGTAFAAQAQDNTETLRTALDHMPEMLLTNPDPMQVYFFDVQAWLGLSAGEPTSAGMMRLSIAQNIEALGVLNYGGLGTWDEKAGIPLDQISYFAGFGQPPLRISYWGFDSDAAALQLIENLGQRDFVAVDAAIDGILGNGEPNFTNLANRDPANPWLGPIGKSSFVLPIDHMVIRAPAPEAMAALAQIEPSAADNAMLATALDGLSATLGVDQGHIVQAMVISPAFGLESFDPAMLLGAAGIEEARAALEAAMDNSTKGIPPYLGGILADTQLEGRPAVTVSLVYPDCDSAESAINVLETRWADNMDTPGEASSQSVTGNEGDLCAAVVSFTGDDASDAGNPLLQETINRFLSRDFNLLQIGLEG